MKGFPRFTAPFPARRLTILCSAIFQLVSGGSAWSQNQPIPEAGAAATGVSFFEANDRLLDTISPIDLGGERFARRLDFVRTMREPLGLVLSGGSARAFAHIGVLKALRREGRPPRLHRRQLHGSHRRHDVRGGVQPRQHRIPRLRRRHRQPDRPRPSLWPEASSTPTGSPHSSAPSSAMSTSRICPFPS